MRYDLRKLEEDVAFWEDLSDRLGWRMMGFTYQDTALFDTHNGTLQLNGRQRNDIMKLVKDNR